MFGVWAAFENAAVDEPMKAVRQYIARQPDAALEVLKATCAIECLAEDHPYPAFADNARGARDRAILLEKLSVSQMLDNRVYDRRYAATPSDDRKFAVESGSEPSRSTIQHSFFVAKRIRVYRNKCAGPDRSANDYF